MPPTDPDPAAPPLVQPVAAPRPGRARLVTRVGLLAVGLLLAAVFATAVYLNPYGADGAPRRMATHRQLGLPECNFVTLTGKPCPSCGMTTSFALLVRGDVRASLAANWAGTLLALAWAALLPWALASAAAGRLLLVRPGRGEIYASVAVGVFMVLMLGRWAGILLSGQ